MEPSINWGRVSPDSAAVDVVARWQQSLWAHHAPADDTEQWQASVRRDCGQQALPSVWLARHAQTPVATASLVAQDGSIRPDLSPWLASVYVEPAWRGRGIASALTEHIAGLAQGAGHPALYLFTPDQQALYARLGWQIIERRLYAGEWVDVMQRNL